jgi:hypothetical protein
MGTVRDFGGEARDSMKAISPPPIFAPRISTAPSSNRHDVARGERHE